MKRVSNLMLVLIVGVFLAASASASVTEDSYINSYRGRTGIPVPVSVVSPEVGGEFSGTTVVMTFVVESDGMPRDIEAVGKVDPELEYLIKDAVRDWVFKPAIVNGKAVATKVKLPFVIRSAASGASVRLASS